jgi:hypothetical protein
MSFLGVKSMGTVYWMEAIGCYVAAAAFLVYQVMCRLLHIGASEGALTEAWLLQALAPRLQAHYEQSKLDRYFRYNMVRSFAYYSNR